MSTATQSAPTLFMQGVAVPATSVRPEEFFKRTRRSVLQEATASYDSASPVPQSVFELRKSDIMAAVILRFTGTLTTDKGDTGTVATTRRWPYDFFSSIQFTANGASNVINASGLKLKVRDIMKRSDLTDRGVSQKIGANTVTQGTLATASESWGVGSGETAIADGTYDLDFFVVVPVAEDEIDLAGAIFLATSSADLTVTVNYASLASLLTLTGDATAQLKGTVQVTSVKYSIPVGADGQIVVPDLSVFHSIQQSRYTDGLATGVENEIRLVGQGAGKSLLRLFFQLWNSGAPVPMTADNFGPQAWRYGTNQSPDVWPDGGTLRLANERMYNCDVGGQWGFGCHEFASENTFRDMVDEGTTSELRLVTTINSGVTLSNPAIEYVTETVYRATQAA